LSAIHKQRSPEEYVALFTEQRYRLVRTKAVIRSPSYALSLWNQHSWLPDLVLPLLDVVERLTVTRKLEIADYVTVAFTFERQ
jgi:hypothetical protein